MKAFLKQVFCSHIWKEINVEFLRKERIADGQDIGGIVTSSLYHIYAKTQKCVKCDKVRIIEKRLLVI